MFWLKACPRCQGDLHEVHEVGDRYVSCLQCGRVLTEQQEETLPRSFGNPEASRLVLRGTNVAA